jgi:hypothetical protein
MSTRAPRAIAGRPKEWGPGYGHAAECDRVRIGLRAPGQMARAGFWLNLAGALLAATMAYFFAGSLLDLDLRGKG